MRDDASIPFPTRRDFLRRAGAIGLASLASARMLAAEMPAGKLSLLHATLPDPDGHHPALRLKGDWQIIGITDGTHTGVGEISHSQDDVACHARAQELFDAHIAGRSGGFHVSLDDVQHLEQRAFATAPDLVTATAISGLNQALLDLVAQRRGVPVWRLFRPGARIAPVQTEVSCYLTCNRALRTRDDADYLRAVEAALALGVEAVKFAPFDAVDRTAGAPVQIKQAEVGLARLALLRKKFPRLSLRVDCHERFTPDAARALLPRFAELQLAWLEEPCPPGPILAELRAAGKIPLAVGELYFGEARFRELLERGWADVIMPDPKHVGGFSPLLGVCRLAERQGAEVSPHNPSGPVATAAALHAAAISPAVTSLELILTSDPARQPGRDLLTAGNLRIPQATGWGLPPGIVQRLPAAK